MESIRTYDGEIRICLSCGQAAHLEGPGSQAEGLWSHFREQWDGVYCDRFPLAGETAAMRWHYLALQQVKDQYPESPTMRTAPAHAGSA